MQWIDFEKVKPTIGEDVLVLKTYLDEPYEEHGYNHEKAFWTKPIAQVDTYWDSKYWNLGGRATYWMRIPEMPKWNG